VAVVVVFDLSDHTHSSLFDICMVNNIDFFLLMLVLGEK
jgi:hypothetical protein